MEARLKADVLREAARYDQHILVTEEDDDMNVGLLASGCWGGVGVEGGPWTNDSFDIGAVLWRAVTQPRSACLSVCLSCLSVQVIDVWEPVTESDVQTPLEVYRELQEDGYDVVSVFFGAVGGFGVQGLMCRRHWRCI